NIVLGVSLCVKEPNFVSTTIDLLLFAQRARAPKKMVVILLEAELSGSEIHFFLFHVSKNLSGPITGIQQIFDQEVDIYRKYRYRRGAASSDPKPGTEKIGRC